MTICSHAQVFEAADETLKEEDAVKERLCSELNMLVQQSAHAQLEKLEQVQNCSAHVSAAWVASPQWLSWSPDLVISLSDAHPLMQHAGLCCMLSALVGAHNALSTATSEGESAILQQMATVDLLSIARPGCCTSKQSYQSMRGGHRQIKAGLLQRCVLL